MFVFELEVQAQTYTYKVQYAYSCISRLSGHIFTIHL